MKPIYSILFILSLLAVGCVSDLDIPLPEHTPKLTINAALSVGEPIDVYLTRSYGIGEPSDVQDILIPDAEVKVYEDDVLLATLTYSDTILQDTFVRPSYVYFASGKYSDANLVVKPGSTYRIEATHPEYGTAIGTTTVPEPPQLVDLAFDPEFDVYEDIYYYSARALITVDVDDPAEEDNYYDFEIEVAYVDTLDGVIDTFTEVIFVTKNLTYDFDGYIYGDASPVADETFDGTVGKIEMLASMPDCCYAKEYTEYNRTISLLYMDIKAYSLSPEFYSARQKFILQQRSATTGIESGLIQSEAVIVPNNIEGGYGMVGAQGAQTFRFNL